MRDNLQNILVINFGQIGDFVLSFPAEFALKRIHQGKITELEGKSSCSLAEMSKSIVDLISVARAKLRDSK